MKCSCVSCQAKLIIENEKLRRLSVPRFTCPVCGQRIRIKGQQANCGHCQTRFSYYAYKLDQESPLVKCISCQKINRIPLVN